MILEKDYFAQFCRNYSSSHFNARKPFVAYALKRVRVFVTQLPIIIMYAREKASYKTEGLLYHNGKLIYFIITPTKVVLLQKQTKYLYYFEFFLYLCTTNMDNLNYKCPNGLTKNEKNNIYRYSNCNYA